MEAQRVQVTCPGNYFFFDVPHITHTHCLQQSSSSFSPSTSSPEFFISENGTSHRYPDIYIRELGVTVDPFSPSITVFVCHHLLLIVSYLSYPQPRLHLFFFWLRRKACGILVSQSEIEPRTPAVEAQSPNLWATREVPPSPSPLLFFPDSGLLQPDLGH